MNHIRYTLLLLIFFLPFCANGQEKYRLTGTLHVKDGDTYPYRLVFDVSKGDIRGYSFTKLPAGSETKAVIKGHINRKKQTLSITETKVLLEPQKDVTNCLIDAKMVYKLQGSNYMVIGAFTGKDDSGKDCGQGVLQFRDPDKESSVFYVETPAKAVTADSVVKPEVHVGENQITAGAQKEYEWTTDSCILDIWDGGVIDGDVVSVLFNGQMILPNYTLAKEKKQFRLRLTGKINTLTIIAEDEGASPPNTTEMILTDGDAHYKITAFNKKGEKAVVVIKKK